MATLLIDIGNSTTVWAEDSEMGLCKPESIPTPQLVDHFSIPIDEYDALIISSVVPEMDAKFKTHSNAIFVTHETIPTLTLNVDTPAAVGADRLVNSLGAKQLVDGDVIVVDSGTAVTFCVVSKDNVYQGGVIVPGMGIASQALNNHTAKIPLIWVSEVDQLLGKTTQAAVESGLYYGYIHMINGIISELKREWPEATVIGTGSGLHVFKDKLDIDVVDEHLIFKGLSTVATHLMT